MSAVAVGTASRGSSWQTPRACRRRASLSRRWRTIALSVLALYAGLPGPLRGGDDVPQANPDDAAPALADESPPVPAACHAAPGADHTAVLAALHEGIVLHGRPEPQPSVAPPRLYVKRLPLPPDWFKREFPAVAHVAVRRSSKWSTPTQARAVRASDLPIEQPNAASLRLIRESPGTASEAASETASPETASTILPTAGWEQPPQARPTASGNPNPLRGATRPAKRNPLRD
jgi:hypothetical protein